MLKNNHVNLSCNILTFNKLLDLTLDKKVLEANNSSFNSFVAVSQFQRSFVAVTKNIFKKFCKKKEHK